MMIARDGAANQEASAKEGVGDGANDDVEIHEQQQEREQHDALEDGDANHVPAAPLSWSANGAPDHNAPSSTTPIPAPLSATQRIVRSNSFGSVVLASPMRANNKQLFFLKTVVRFYLR